MQLGCRTAGAARAPGVRVGRQACGVGAGVVQWSPVSRRSAATPQQESNVMEPGTVRCDRVDDTLVVRARLADVVGGEESRTLARLSDEYADCDLVLVCTDAREVPEHAVNAVVAAYSAQLKKKRR